MTTPHLSDHTANGRARAAALARVDRGSVAPTSLVTFLSHGRVLIVGDEQEALVAAQQLNQSMPCVVLAPSSSAPATHSVNSVTVVRGGWPALTGRLGNFSVAFPGPGAPPGPGGGTAPPTVDLLANARFDLVLDLGDPPLLSHEVPPLGYYAPGDDPEARQRAIDQLPEMRGEFLKPRFFDYNPDICAHGASGLSGCTRCLDACPTLAITSLGDKVSVDPHLCQGGGGCASVCPTGAITYAFPTVVDLLHHVRDLLATYREAGGESPGLMFYDAESAAQVSGATGERLPENILPVEVEEVGSTGMDAWLGCLAYGAAAVLLLTGSHTAPRIVAALREQVGYARAMLDGMGYAQGAIDIIDGDDPALDDAGQISVPEAAVRRAARFTAPDDKRGLVRLALNHLYAQAPTPRQLAALPPGAPFGQVKVDRNACTLCMSCVSVCPTAALRDGQGLPQLNFMEWACVQCGLCETACPEDAVTLEARLLYDDERRATQRTLHEEQPFLCIVCAKPFATQSMLKVMESKLAGHWMFQTDDARRRLKMCDTCRVKDMMRAQGPGGQMPGRN